MRILVGCLAVVVIVAAMVWAMIAARRRERAAMHTATYDEQRAAEHLRPLAGIVVIRPVHKLADELTDEPVQSPPPPPPDART